MYSCSSIWLYKSICPSPLTLSLRCYYYTICNWCMESHLSSDASPVLASLPCPLCLACAACVAATLSRLPCVPCPWCLSYTACWCPSCCAVFVGCVPGSLASCPALYRWAVCAPVYWPALWTVWLGLILRPCTTDSLECLLKKALIFALYFSGILSLDFSPQYTGLYFSRFIFPAS